MNLRPCSLIFLLCLATTVSCMKSHPDTKVCKLTTGLTPLTQNATIVYKLTARGSTYVNHIMYHDLLSPATVRTPGLPFIVTIQGQAGQSVAMEVDGIAMEGALIMEQHIIVHAGDTATIREVCAD